MSLLRAISQKCTHHTAGKPTRAGGETPRALKACTWPSDWSKPRGFKKGYKTMAMVQLCQTSWPSWVSNEAEPSNYRNYESFVIGLLSLQKDVKCYFWTEPLFDYFVTSYSVRTFSQFTLCLLFQNITLKMKTKLFHLIFMTPVIGTVKVNPLSRYAT